MKKLKENINIRNLIIIVLCITIILMAIGFGILSMNIDTKEPKFDVSFTTVEQTSSAKGGFVNPIGEYIIKSNGKKVDFKFTLNNPYDEMIYQITIKNNGTIPAKIEDILEYPEYTTDYNKSESIKPIKINYNDVKDTILDPEETTEINLVIQFDQGQPAKKEINYSLVLIASS